ncbi:MAG: hypothetical protein QNJ33_06895 [Crocosphaera sp.]|nr:hypothetical protein [Crocosphaera sp.]
MKNQNHHQNPNQEEKHDIENSPQNVEEIESLNDSDELGLENLEEIDGGSCGLNFGCGTKNAQNALTER